jgi:hypothetical protein
LWLLVLLTSKDTIAQFGYQNIIVQQQKTDAESIRMEEKGIVNT